MPLDARNLKTRTMEVTKVVVETVEEMEVVAVEGQHLPLKEST